MITAVAFHWIKHVRAQDHSFVLWVRETCVGYGRCQLVLGLSSCCSFPATPQGWEFGGQEGGWEIPVHPQGLLAGPAGSSPPPPALHGRIPGLCINLRFCGFWNTVSFYGFPSLPLWRRPCHRCVQLEVSAPARGSWSSGHRQLLVTHRVPSDKLVSLMHLVSAPPWLCFPSTIPGHMLSLSRLIFKRFKSLSTISHKDLPSLTWKPFCRRCLLLGVKRIVS